MSNYKAPNQDQWSGRTASEALYWHQKVQFIDISNQAPSGGVAILSYAVDEGVRRNQGRVGAADGPTSIINQLAKLSDHTNPQLDIYDVGTLSCVDDHLEDAHDETTGLIKLLLNNNCLPIVLGGGHDLAFAHYNGIKNHLSSSESVSKIGIINLDAHFDLREVETVRNSGTPFSQIAEDCKRDNSDFNYLCLGIQAPANNKQLYKTAEEHSVQYMEMADFQLSNWRNVSLQLSAFMEGVDVIYLTIDMDGFSSAYAPGVSAPSPMGFEPQLIIKVLDEIISTKKLISMDVVELNPQFDQDNVTARLAARLIEYIIRKQA